MRTLHSWQTIFPFWTAPTNVLNEARCATVSRFPIVKFPYPWAFGLPCQIQQPVLFGLER